MNIDVQKKQQNVDYNYNIKNILTRNRSNKFRGKKKKKKHNFKLKYGLGELGLENIEVFGSPRASPSLTNNQNDWLL